MTNSSGTVTDTYSYDEYGQPNSWSGSRFRYTGQMLLPAAQLYHYKARIYSPNLGRFLQTDPILHAGGMNLYAYVGNDPVNFTDPWGLEDVTDTIVVTGRCDFWCEVGRFFGGASGDSGGVDPVGWDQFLRDQGQQGRPSCGFSTDPELAAEQCAFSELREEISNELAVDACVNYVCPELAGGPVGLVAGNLLVRGGGWLLRALNWACCFVEGTPVTTSEGLVPIEAIEVGDLVRSRDPETGETGWKPVTALIPGHPRELWTVTFEVGASTASFGTTDDHPWRTADGRWLRTDELRAGMAILRAEGRPARVVSAVNTGTTAITYNLEIADWHTYFVGEAQIWVHNACPLSPNQMNRALQRGQAPRGIGRTDVGRVVGEQQHTIIANRGAINIDGTWKHGGGALTREQADWLRAQGYNIP